MGQYAPCACETARLRKLLKLVVKSGCINGCTKIGWLGFGGCSRLFRRTTFNAFCAACLWTLERFPAIRHSPKMPVVLVLLRSKVLTPSNLLLVLELRSHKSDHVLTCDVKV